MTNKKIKLAVWSTGASNKIGPITTVIVGVDSNFFRKYSLEVGQQNDAYLKKMVNAAEHFFISEVKARDITQPAKQTVSEVMNCLNTYPEFWVEDVNLSSKQSTPFLLIQECPKRIKFFVEQVAPRWTWDHDSKVMKFARLVAESALKQRHEEIKKVYGDFGTGFPDDPKTIEFIKNNEECIHIRQEGNNE
jgi:hypothetical protein